MTTVITPRTAAIAALNDAFRNAGPTEDWVVTEGVADRGAVFIAAAYCKVIAFDAFAPNNDPYGEHDFGAFMLDGERLFWKIDYYDDTRDWGPPDPTDVVTTVRVLTVMLSREF
jgi:hypothetical protein